MTDHGKRSTAYRADAADPVVWAVLAPAEGDGPEDAVYWYFKREEDAEAFAYESHDHQICQPGGPYPVEKWTVPRERYRKIHFSTYRGGR